MRMGRKSASEWSVYAPRTMVSNTTPAGELDPSNKLPIHVHGGLWAFCELNGLNLNSAEPVLASASSLFTYPVHELTGSQIGLAMTT